MKTLWGIDPFHLTNPQLKKTFEFVSAISGADVKVEAGFVVTHTENDLRLAFDIPAERRFSEYPREILETKLKKSGVPLSRVNLNVINYPTLSTTQAARRLLKLANDKACDLCVIFSQGGSELRKLFLGSFADSAVQVGDRNLLIVNPHSKLSKKIKTIFFCYEPSPSSKGALKDILSLCKETNAKLVVFHAANFNYRITAKDAGPAVNQYRKQVDQIRDSVEKQCVKVGVDFEIQVSTDFERVSDLALRNSKRAKADLIAVVAKSGRLASLIGGSVTRQILRASSIPVLVMR